MWRRMIGLAALATIIIGCHDGSPAPKGGKPVVVCTTGMVADLVRNIVGERAEVVQLLGAGIDPHRYKVSPKDERQLRSADFVAYSGFRLEGRMADGLEELRKRQPVASVAEFLDPKQALTENDGVPDPHVWFDVGLWGSAAPGRGERLAEWRPEHAAEFRANAARYAAALQTLHAEIKSQLAAVPKERRVLVTSHDAFRYFGRAYDFEVRGVQGISTEDEADVRHLNELVSFLVERRIPAVFVESTVPPRNLQAVLEGCKSLKHEVRIGGELYSDALGEVGSHADTYQGMIRANAAKLVEALK